MPVQSQTQRVVPIDYESFLNKHRIIFYNDPHRELLLFPPDDISVSLMHPSIVNLATYLSLTPSSKPKLNGIFAQLAQQCLIIFLKRKAIFSLGNVLSFSQASGPLLFISTTLIVVAIFHCQGKIEYFVGTVLAQKAIPPNCERIAEIF